MPSYNRNSEEQEE